MKIRIEKGGKNERGREGGREEENRRKERRGREEKKARERDLISLIIPLKVTECLVSLLRHLRDLPLGNLSSSIVDILLLHDGRLLG